MAFKAKQNLFFIIFISLSPAQVTCLFSVSILAKIMQRTLFTTGLNDVDGLLSRMLSGALGSTAEANEPTLDSSRGASSGSGPGISGHSTRKDSPSWYRDTDSSIPTSARPSRVHDTRNISGTVTVTSSTGDLEQLPVEPERTFAPGGSRHPETPRSSSTRSSEQDQGSFDGLMDGIFPEVTQESDSDVALEFTTSVQAEATRADFSGPSTSSQAGLADWEGELGNPHISILGNVASETDTVTLGHFSINVNAELRTRDDSNPTQDGHQEENGNQRLGHRAGDREQGISSSDPGLVCGYQEVGGYPDDMFRPPLSDTERQEYECAIWSVSDVHFFCLPSVQSYHDF